MKGEGPRDRRGRERDLESGEGREREGVGPRDRRSRKREVEEGGVGEEWRGT